jgi:hypothetical protein
VAFGVSMLAWSPSFHFSTNYAVSMWPAARTGRSAKAIELGDTPVRVS